MYRNANLGRSSLRPFYSSFSITFLRVWSIRVWEVSPVRCGGTLGRLYLFFVHPLSKVSIFCPILENMTVPPSVVTHRATNLTTFVAVCARRINLPAPVMALLASGYHFV
jgi:hypothetical protein